MGRHRRSSDDEPSDEDYGQRSASDLLRAAGYELPEARRRRARRERDDAEPAPAPPHARPAPAPPPPPMNPTPAPVRRAEPPGRHLPAAPQGRVDVPPPVAPGRGQPPVAPAQPPPAPVDRYPAAPPARPPADAPPGHPSADRWPEPPSYPGLRPDPRLGHHSSAAGPGTAPEVRRGPSGPRSPQPPPERAFRTETGGPHDPRRAEPARRDPGDDRRGTPPGREVVLSGERRPAPLRPDAPGRPDLPGRSDLPDRLPDRAYEPDDVPPDRLLPDRLLPDRLPPERRREVAVHPPGEPRGRRGANRPDRHGGPPDHADDDYLDIDPDADDDGEPDDDGGRSLRQAWLAFVTQILVAAAAGLALWLGFQTLWRRWPWAAAPAAGLVLVGMLLVGHFVHRRRHPDEPLDLVTVGVLLVVGLVLTVSPAAFVLRPF